MLQGPGCLNFSLVLSLDRRPELRDTSKGFRAILERTARALEVDGLSLEGISDLALGDRKISGNAQKRRRRALLHHGTLLHHFNVERVARWLRDPEKQPEYRKGRPHGAFLGNLPAAPEDLRSRLARAWGASPPRGAWKMPSLDHLISEKYGNSAWTHRA